MGEWTKEPPRMDGAYWVSLAPCGTGPCLCTNQSSPSLVRVSGSWILPTEVSRDWMKMNYFVELYPDAVWSHSASQDEIPYFDDPCGWKDISDVDELKRRHEAGLPLTFWQRSKIGVPVNLDDAPLVRLEDVTA